MSKLGPLEEFTAIYRAGALLGIDAARLDECEIWQVAAMCGMDDGQATGPAPVLSPQQQLMERVRAAREGTSESESDREAIAVLGDAASMMPAESAPLLQFAQRARSN